MKTSRFTDEQMVTILREADKAPVAEAAKKHGISEQTIYNWRQHFGGLEAADVKRLKQLEQENARLKKMLAERDSVHVGRYSARAERSTTSSVRHRGHMLASIWQSPQREGAGDVATGECPGNEKATVTRDDDIPKSAKREARVTC